MTPPELPESCLSNAAETVTSTPMDRFPPLITYTCLGDSWEPLAAAARAMLDTEAPAVTELLSMPRERFGSRPAEVMSPASRTLYTALADHLSGALVEPTRRDGAWTEFREFGRSGDHSHIVEMDMTSCYELIDHLDLAQELLLRSFDHATTTSLTTLLRGVGRRGRGIPQMLSPSDRFADTYLSLIDRNLMRRGWECKRFADDFRVLASSWDQANEVIEVTSSFARSVGLVLSTAKTVVLKRETLEQQLADAEAFRSKHLELNPDDVDDYGGAGDHINQPANIAEAGYNLIRDWYARRNDADPDPEIHRLLRQALNVATDHPSPLEPETLNELVFDSLLRFENVCQYVIRRDDGTDYRNQVLERLVASVRRSPWAKLWLLHLAEQIDRPSFNVQLWVEEQLTDSHEVVRVQAAWALASSGCLSGDSLSEVYVGATAVSGPAVAAAAARQNKIGSSLPSGTVASIKGDGPLNAEAFKWAT